VASTAVSSSNVAAVDSGKVGRSAVHIRYKVKLPYDQRSVVQSVTVSGYHLGPETNCAVPPRQLSSDFCGSFSMGAFSDERTGL
jgi:hypothetical protein